MYGTLVCDQSFQQKCQAWVVLLEKLESGFSSDISGNDSSIRAHLAEHQVRCLFLSVLPLYVHSLSEVSSKNVLIRVQLRQVLSYHR